jgi:hypothetical protein
MIMNKKTMSKLLTQAKQAGGAEAEHVGSYLAWAFDSWVAKNNLKEIPDAEYFLLKAAFGSGFRTTYYPDYEEIKPEDIPY